MRCAYFHGNITVFGIIKSSQLVKSLSLQPYGQNNLFEALQLSRNSESTSRLDDSEQLCCMSNLYNSLISEYMDLNVHHITCKLVLHIKCGVILHTV